MAAIADAVYTILQADATLAALATGGGYLIDKQGSGGADKHPINPEDTPSAYTTVSNVSRLKPCYTVKTQGRQSIGRGQFSYTIEVRAYERSGYQNTRAMLDRIYVLLDNGSGSALTAEGKAVEIMHSTDLTASYDDSLSIGQGKRGASMEAATYTALGARP